MVNISLNNSSSLSFLNVYAQSICSFSMDSRIDFFASLFFRPSEGSSFWKTSTAINSSGTQKVLLIPVVRKFSIGPSPLISLLSMTPTLLLLWQSLLSRHLFCSLLSCPLLRLKGASELGLESHTNSTNCPYFFAFPFQLLTPFLQFSESLLR